MNDAEGQTVTIRLAASPFGSETYEFGTSGTVITSPGFMSLYGRQSDESDDEERELPNLSEGDAVLATSLESKDHQTKPPARYTEATLVRQLEELGVGRPSTYAAFLAPSKSRLCLEERPSVGPRAHCICHSRPPAPLPTPSGLRTYREHGRRPRSDISRRNRTQPMAR